MPLRTWKEIAAHLNVSVRTAQIWERDRGLPVRRLPGAASRVLAEPADLDNWLQTHPQTREAPVFNDAAPQRRPWPLVAAGLAAIAVCGLAGALAWTFWLRPQPQPDRWRIDYNAFIVQDEEGRELWRKKFQRELKNPSGADPSSRLHFVEIADLDRDGQREVLFGATPRSDNETGGVLLCYSARGRERWKFLPAARARTFQKDLRGHYSIAYVGVVPHPSGPKILVAANSRLSHACQIALLSRDGKLEREYWHSGHLQQIAIGDPYRKGRPWIFAAGISNAHRQATMLVLDPEKFGGASREDNPEYQIPLPPSHEVARLLFPHSSLPLLQTPYNIGLFPTLHERGLDLPVQEETAPGGEPLAAVNHGFGPNLEYEGVSFQTGFLMRFKELQARGAIAHDLAQEKARLERVRWLTPPEGTLSSLHVSR